MARQAEDTMTRDLCFFSTHRSEDGALTEVGQTLSVGAMRSGMGALSMEALHTLLGTTRAPASRLDADENTAGEGS